MTSKLFRPIVLFLTGNNNANDPRARDYDCDYAPVGLEEEPLPPHLHPLLIPAVISKVSAHLSTKDLLSCRLVCQLWNAEAVPLLQKKVRHMKVQPRRMREFLRVFRRSNDLPVQSFAFYTDHSEHTALLSLVAEALFHTITSLRLNIAGQELPYLPRILQNLTLLKELVILRIPEKSLPPSYRKFEPLEEDLRLPLLTSITFGNTHPNTSLPFICNYDNFITDIINGAENLVNLEFINWKSPLQQVLRFLELPPTIERLTLAGTSVKESEVATLRKKSLPLKQLTITLGTTIRDSTLSAFFETLEGTLETLEISCEGPFAQFPVDVPLPYLKSLRFHGWKSSIVLDDFMSRFPSLESVELLDFQFISFTDYSSYRKNGRSVLGDSLVRTVVARPCEGDELADMNIASLVAAFPNTKRLKGYNFTDPMCELVFTHWPGLEFLCLEACKFITDGGLTGIPVESIWKVTEDEGPLGCKCDDVARAEQSRQTNNYIGNLKDLKFLYLKGRGSLTNASLHYGILQLDSLTELELPSDDYPWCIECISKLSSLKKFYIKSIGEVVTVQDLLFLKQRIPALKTICTHAAFRAG